MSKNNKQELEVPTKKFGFRCGLFNKKPNAKLSDTLTPYPGYQGMQKLEHKQGKK